LNGVIEVHELVVPYPSVIQALPLCLRSPSYACLSTVEELASEIIDRDNAEDKVEKERDYHDRDDPRYCNAKGLDAHFQAFVLGNGSKGPQHFEQPQGFY